MKEITVKAYEFGELNSDAQARALVNHQHILVTDESWYEPIMEGFWEDMRSAGVLYANPAFSGFWSQGDGACFTAHDIDVEKLLIHMADTKFFDVPESWETEARAGAFTVEIRKGDESFCRRYDHSNTITADVNYVGERLDSREVHDMEIAVTAWARAESDKLYASLEKYYNELTTDEAIREEIEQAGLLFSENGETLYIR